MQLAENKARRTLSVAAWVLSAGVWLGGGGSLAHAATYSVIYVSQPLVGPGADFGPVEYNMVADAKGNLYASGALYYGSVFVLAPPASTSTHWRSKIIYLPVDCSPAFPAGCVPTTLVWYGNALMGSANGGGLFNDGTVFQIVGGSQTPPRVLYNFGPKLAQGFGPGSLSTGPYHLLYGLAGGGGNKGENGLVFSFDPVTSVYTVIHRFGIPGDGFTAGYGQLVSDAQNRLYGETALGGANGVGVVYALQRVGGAWGEQVIYNFKSSGDAYSPGDGMVIDAQGNLYGCAQGGLNGYGAVFKLAPPATPGGQYTETLIHNFDHGQATAGSSGHGCALTLDPDTGHLLGTAAQAGYHGWGALFDLAPPAAGQTDWSYSIIHSFTNTPSDGQQPDTPPLKVGQYYYGGTFGHYSGGTYSGTIYQFSP